ncbi:thioredoxin family protein [Staphylococcus ratti]|uniref:Thioredoxin family protein n=1 Tax=Staphylococcus ratti TaxID=2892440 RepID=A0ABY3PF38_9STAP|nr:thioredoxin family protein [Staphylococcus ratti]UEX90937.1 thioredoxin family protein [Staphylococcus ratti]
MKTIQNEADYKKLTQEKTVFMFTAGWCPDCRVIEPDLPKLEEKYANFNFISVDRDAFIDLAIEEGVMGIPSFIVYEDGKRVGDYIGKERKSIAQIDDFLSQF